MTKVLMLSGTAILSIYLFATAPPPLPEHRAAPGPSIATATLFRTVDAINAGARQIYTRRIVGGGKAAGLGFGEDWAEPGVEKGPLPALFLRLVAEELERRPERLGLFLASDAPINPSNLLTGVQSTQFKAIKADRQPRIFGMDGYGQVALFPDIASVQPCVTCHNDHEDSPRKDWRLGDVMGATTWTYPEATLAQADYLNVVAATYASVADAYRRYLDKARTFERSPEIGAVWPEAGARRLPDVATFMAEVRAATAPGALMQVLGQGDGTTASEAGS